MDLFFAFSLWHSPERLWKFLQFFVFFCVSHYVELCLKRKIAQIRCVKVVKQQNKPRIYLLFCKIPCNVNACQCLSVFVFKIWHLWRENNYYNLCQTGINLLLAGNNYGNFPNEDKFELLSFQVFKMVKLLCFWAVQ